MVCMYSANSSVNTILARLSSLFLWETSAWPLCLLCWKKIAFIQVNLCQKLLFLHQITHNVTTDSSLNYKFNTWKFLAQNMLCTEIVFDIPNNFCTQHVLPMFCKKKIFWQRSTCTYIFRVLHTEIWHKKPGFQNMYIWKASHRKYR